MRVMHYPIFLAARDSAVSLFWKKVFENLAYREPPKGIYFKDETLYSVTKKKEFNYSFADKPAELIYQELYDLFSRVFGLKSKSDISRKKEIFDQFTQTNSARKSEDTWSRIKKKTLKENLIQDYVLESQTIHNLTIEQARKLYFYISVGLVFKLFTPADIHMRGGVISHVDGIDLDDGQIYIARQFKEPRHKKQSPYENNLYDLWNTYLKSI